MMPTIQQVVNDVLFKNKGDDGICWAKYYNPFPIVGFALAIMAVGFNLCISHFYSRHSSD